jgi:hypothetical protein
MKRPDAPLSASEVGLARRCWRKWAARYVWDEWPDPGGAHFETGRAFHKLCEVYATSGQVTRDVHPIVDMWLEALKFLPPPRTHQQIETREEITIAGLPFELTPDWFGPASTLPGAAHDGPAIVDYKTSTDPKRYGVISEAAKLDDTQTVLYAFAKFSAEPGLFRHLYSRKTGQVLAWEASQLPPGEARERLERKAAKQSPTQRCFPADAILQPRDVREAMERVILPVAERVWQIRSRGQRVDPLTLPPTAAECDAYGGCPHKARCKLTPAQQLAGALGVRSMSLDFFASLPSINGPAAVPPATAAPAAPSFTAPAAQAAPSFTAPAAQAPVQTGFAYAPELSPVSPITPGVSPQQLLDLAREDAELGRALRLLLAAWRGRS